MGRCAVWGSTSGIETDQFGVCNAAEIGPSHATRIGKRWNLDIVRPKQSAQLPRHALVEERIFTLPLDDAAFQHRIPAWLLRRRGPLSGNHQELIQRISVKDVTDQRIHRDTRFGENGHPTQDLRGNSDWRFDENKLPSEPRHVGL